MKDKTAVILDTSPLYAEMGGQVGDTGELEPAWWRLGTIANTQKAGDAGCISSRPRTRLGSLEQVSVVQC